MHTAIITSTVYVNSDFIVLTDPNVRMEQYVDSIMFYLNSKTISNIIVCDNSGFDFYRHASLFHTIANKERKQIEFLSFVGDGKCIMEKGKGYGEGEIMRYTLSNSKLIHNCDSFLKITGRIKVQNIDSVLRHIVPGNVYFQNVGTNPFIHQKKVDTRLYYCSKKGFEEHLLDAFLSVNDKVGYYLEHAFFDNLEKHNIVYKNFPILPRFYGISGSTGKLYTKSELRWLTDKAIYKLFRPLRR
jgi:hypothetical protein